MLKRIGAGAAIAWTAPILTSIRTPAFAQSGGGNCGPCAGDFCLGQSICNTNAPCFLGLCGCAQPFGHEGGGTCNCYCNDICVNRQTCPTGSCPPGQLCLHTCCDVLQGPTCFDPCTPGPSGAKKNVGRRQGGRVTGLGRM
jgi:hypothetical protein